MRKRIDRWALPLVIVTMTGVAFAQDPMGGFPPALVEVAEAELREMAPVVEVPGTVVSLNDSRIAAEVSGALVWIADVGTAVDTGDVASYDVLVVSDVCGSTLSAPATLSVETSPTITTQPTSEAVCEGTPVVFSVAHPLLADFTGGRHESSAALPALRDLGDAVLMRIWSPDNQRPRM